MAQLSLRNSMHQEAPSRWQISAQYALLTDLMEETEPRIFEHDVTLNSIYNINNQLRLGGFLNVNYFTLEDEFAETQEDYGKFQPSMNIFSSYRLGTPFFTSHNVNVGYFLPLDDHSRYEGYKGVPSISTTFVKKAWKHYILLLQNFNASYVINTFDKNALGQPNRTFGVSASPTVMFNFTQHISFLLGFGIRWTQLSDGNTDYMYNNSQTLSFNYQPLTVFIRHFNGGYTEDGRVDLWYIDKHRKFVDLGVSYDF